MKISKEILKKYPEAIFVPTDTPCCEDDLVQLNGSKSIQILGSVYGYNPSKYSTESIIMDGGNIKINMGTEVYDTLKEAVNSFN